MLDDVEVAEGTLPLGDQPVVYTGAVEGVGAREAADLLPLLQGVEAHRTLCLGLPLPHHQQRHAAQRLLSLPAQPSIQLILDNKYMYIG